MKRPRQGDLDAELTLVRAAVEHPKSVARVLDMVRPDDFTDPICGKIWQVVQRLIRSGRPVDFNHVVGQLKPDDVLGPDLCREATVADCIRQTLSEGSGTAVEARWCTLRIRADAHRRALLDVLDDAARGVVAGKSATAKSLLRNASAIAAAYDTEHRAATRELRRLRERIKRNNVKTIRVRETFHISGRDCLIVVGDQDVPAKRGDSFESNRGVRVRVAALIALTRSDGLDRAVCIEPRDADVRAGDVLTLSSTPAPAAP